MKKVSILFIFFAGFWLNAQETTIRANITVINNSDKQLLKVKFKDLTQLDLKPGERGSFQSELIPMSSVGSNLPPLTYFLKDISINDSKGKLFSLFARIDRNNNNETFTIFTQLTPATTAPFVIYGKDNEVQTQPQPQMNFPQEINLTATIETNNARSTLTMTTDQTVK